MNIYIPNIRLPSAYQEVEYIQSIWDSTNNGQYIDIWYSFQNNKGRISMKYSPVDFWSSWSWKRATWSYNNTSSIYVYWNYSSFYIWMGSNYIDTWYTMTTWTDYEVDIAADNWNYTLSYNWNTSSWTYSSTIVNNRTLSIFSAHVADSGTTEYYYRSSMKLYYYKLWDNWVLQRDLVPCYRKSDWEIWLYDLVNNRFYTNSWTWAFTKWADVTMSEVKNIYIGEYVAPQWNYVTETYDTTFGSQSNFSWVCFTPNKNCSITKVKFLWGSPLTWTLKIAQRNYAGDNWTTYSITSTNNPDWIYELSTPYQLTANTNYFISFKDSTSIFYWNFSMTYPVQCKDIIYNYWNKGSNWYSKDYDKAYAISWLEIATS